jgi:hypothetical protein
MTRPTKAQIAAAAHVLATDWDADGSKAPGAPDAYKEWGAGIADMILHDPPPDTLIEYLGVLETQLAMPLSPLEERTRWAERLTAAVRAAAG